MQKQDRWEMNRRSFFKTTGTGILCATLWGLPSFRTYSLNEAMAAAGETGETAIPTFCGMCGPSAGCGIYAFVKNGRFTRVAGMKECPSNRGGICPKGQSAPQWVYSPDRLKTPLKRVGAKGEGKFQKITWDEAIGLIAEKLKKQKQTYGPESLAMLSPARRAYSDYMQRFLIVHGSPNYGHSGICGTQKDFTFAYTLGAHRKPGCDYEKSEVLLIWGRQPVYSGPTNMVVRNYLAAKKRGAKIIAIKPSIEPDSGMADIWVPIRPGTDAALALAMLNVIVNENLIDKAFVETYCYGYDKLKDHVQKYKPAWAEKITGIPAAQIQEVARIYATAGSAGIDLGNGVEHASSASDAIRGVAILMAVTGNLNRPEGGGNKLSDSMGPGGEGGIKGVNLMERYTPEMLDKLVGPEFPRSFQPYIEGASSSYYKVLNSVLTEDPYPVRTIIAPGTQPTVSTRGTKRVIEALKKLDFYVVVDVTRTADMDYADIVLPTATVYESDHPFGSMGGKIMARRKVIEPLGPYKSIFQFFLDLGVAMGYGDDFWGGSMTACANDLLSPLNITIDEVRKHPLGYAPPASGGGKARSGRSDDRGLAEVFATRSTRLGGAPYLPQGKIAIYNTTFESEGLSPLPEWREPPESVTGTPELAKKYPLILSDYHTSKCYSASWQRNVPYLREIMPYPTLDIHPDTAAARGIHNGDWVIVQGPHGWMKVKAELYPGIRPDTVMLLHGWWQGCKELGFEDFPLADGGANVNNMYSTDPKTSMDPLITANASQTLVEVRKA